MSIRVFLSATFSDMRAERLEIAEVFRRLRTVESLDVDLITMEDFGFSSLPPPAKCLEQLDVADAYLGILGVNYGSLVKGKKQSFTDMEYRHAHERKIPIFLLQKQGSVDADDVETDPFKVKRLNQLKKHANDNHVVLRFSDQASLGRALATHLPKELRAHFGSIGMDPKAPARVPIFQQRSRPVLLDADRTDVRQLDVLAWTSAGLLRDRNLIEAYVKRGCSIRIINVAQEGHAVRMLRARKKSLVKELGLTKERVEELHQSLSAERGSIELRSLDWLPSSCLFIANGGGAGATAWVGSYTPNPQTPSGQKWMIDLQGEAGRCAREFYVQQFEELWATASHCAGRQAKDGRSSLRRVVS